jgi:hypothetical protein
MDRAYGKVEMFKDMWGTRLRKVNYEHRGPHKMRGPTPQYLSPQ